ncbi:peroxidase family protein [Neolewinella aurantiaca]|uniref:peroxidase family protein n=1 Tax=Neolewinella aurantiaca TaxID=2602767 RepID=UPI001C9BC84F|nr:peroxidase family protein [Neolewinella aurantiaca]
MKLLLSCCLLFSFIPSQAQTVDTDLYRTFTGESNNPDQQNWGASHTALIRLAGDGYVDGQSIPPGENRPNPRTVSNTLFAQEGLFNDPVGLSDYTWVFGQFIDHDVTLTEIPQEYTPIPVPAGDPDFDPFFFGSVVIPFNRNAPRPNTGFGIGNPRNYNNDISAFIDGSGVYGSDEARANWLRSFSDGKLKVSSGNLMPYNTIDGEIDSPLDPTAPHMDDAVGRSPYHFVAGDVRANENPLLASFHTLFVREHNLQCERLKSEHPDWDDEQLYQHARKIVGGLIQAIVYNEWLPAMGVPVGEYQGYDPQVNPQLTNTFTAAAFRVGHTLLNGNLRRLDVNGNVIPEGNMTLRDAFFNPTVLAEVGLDPFLRGMAEQVQQKMDSKVVDDVRNFLFGPPGAGGLDLASINIMRGRDRGLPSYNNIRLAYNLPINFTFDQINPDQEVYTVLETLYDNNIEEIDPWVAMLAERSENGSIFGSTIRRIMETQFSNLRTGDRFFYLNDPVLSEDEKDMIHTTTFQEIVMRNSSIELMQENVFEAMPFSEICGDAVTSTDGWIQVHTVGTQLPDVTVSANGDNGSVMGTSVTSDLGFYEFETLPACQDIVLTASLNDDWVSGVNIFDMIAINRHLLGLQYLENPYQLIAGDVNNDKSLDVMDIIDISRQQLGYIDSFPGGNAQPWIFIPAGYDFVDPEFPFDEDIPFSIDFARVPPSEINQGFVAIKLGDVNADLQIDANNQPPGLWVEVPEEEIAAGDQRTIELQFSGEELNGFQFGLQAQGLRVLDVVSTDLPESAYRLRDGELQFVSLENGTTRHSVVLTVQADRSGPLADMFSLTPDTAPVAVDLSGAPRSVQIGTTAGAGSVALESTVSPNPFTNSVRLSFASPLTESANLELLDVNGRTLYTEVLTAGTESSRIDGLSLPAGTYLVRVLSAASGDVLFRKTLQSVAR